MGADGSPAVVVLLDVDGVIAPLGAPVPGRPSEVVESAGWAGPIRYHSDVVARLAVMHAEGVVEVRWLTTWQDAANAFLAVPLGFPPLITYTRDEAPYAPTVEWWKLRHVREFVETTDQRFVWCDDELHLLADDDTILEHVRSGRLLTISPDPAVGLTPEHVADIETFATG